MFKDFKGQQLDGDIITNSGADRISEVGRVTVLSTHNKLQVIVFPKLLYLIWFEISMKKHLSHYFGQAVNITKLVCTIVLQGILPSENAKQSYKQTNKKIQIVKLF